MDFLLKNGSPIDWSLQKLQDIVDLSKYIVAHNGEAFDFKILNKYIKNLEDKIFIDTLIHIPLKQKSDSNVLKYKCFDYDIIVNKTKIHEANYDVFLTKELLFKYGFENALKNSQQKYINVKAIVSFNEKDKAKKHNFVWVDKCWQKKLLEEDFNNEKDKYDFKYLVE